MKPRMQQELESVVTGEFPTTNTAVLASRAATEVLDQEAEIASRDNEPSGEPDPLPDDFAANLPSQQTDDAAGAGTPPEQQINPTDPEAVAAQHARDRAFVAGIAAAIDDQHIRLDWIKRERGLVEQQSAEAERRHGAEVAALQQEYLDRVAMIRDRHDEHMNRLSRSMAEKDIEAGAIRKAIEALDGAL